MVKLLNLAVLAVLISATCGSLAQADDCNVTLDLQNIPVREAIDAVFSNTGFNYVLADDVCGYIPNLSLTDVPFDQALRTITRTSGLTLRIENSVYFIEKKKEPVRNEANKAVAESDSNSSQSNDAPKPNPVTVVRIKNRTTNEKSSGATFFVPTRREALLFYNRSQSVSFAGRGKGRGTRSGRYGQLGSTGLATTFVGNTKTTWHPTANDYRNQPPTYGGFGCGNGNYNNYGGYNNHQAPRCPGNGW
jgi:hypothetical protein